MNNSAVLEQWLTHLDAQGKSPHTIAAYRRALNHFTQWQVLLFTEEADWSVIIPRDIRDWKSYQTQVEKAAPGTINQRLTALSRFYQWAVTQDLIKDDPTVGVQVVRQKKPAPKALSEADLRRLLRAVHASDNLRDIAIIEVLVGTGIRVGELLDLQMGDITLRQRSGILIVREGKHDSYREIPLIREVRQALENYLTQPSAADEVHAPLWQGIHGYLTHRSTILRILKRYAYQAKIGDITPHQLRHTFATRYLAANPDDLRGLAALLGHHSLDMVMCYTEPTLEDMTTKMERVEAGLLGSVNAD
jgi:site-specific recombinase XerD